MLTDFGTMQMARDAMAHAAARQVEVARNIANADTPGYRARDALPFDPGRPGGLALRATRAAHLPGTGPGTAARIVAVGGEASPNGNDVSLEDELVRAASVRREHELALAVYQSGLRLTRTALGRRA